MFSKNFKVILICLVLALSFSATAASGADILFISAMDEDTEPGDEALRVYIEGLGHTVTMFDDNESEADTEVAAAEADLVFISESVSSSEIREEITEIETPMIITEAWGYDEMGLTLGTGEGIDVATTEIEIVNPGHPLAAGLSGTVSVLTDLESERGIARFSTGDAGSDSTVIARVPIATNEATLTDDMQEYTLSLSAADVPESVGKKVGIEFSNSSTGDTWIGLDNIRLELLNE